MNRLRLSQAEREELTRRRLLKKKDALFEKMIEMGLDPFARDGGADDDEEVKMEAASNTGLEASESSTTAQMNQVVKIDAPVTISAANDDPNEQSTTPMTGVVSSAVRTAKMRQ